MMMIEIIFLQSSLNFQKLKNISIKIRYLKIKLDPLETYYMHAFFLWTIHVYRKIKIITSLYSFCNYFNFTQPFILYFTFYNVLWKIHEIEIFLDDWIYVTPGSILLLWNGDLDLQIWSWYRSRVWDPQKLCKATKAAPLSMGTNIGDLCNKSAHQHINI